MNEPEQEDIVEAITDLQTILLENVSQIRKELSASFSPVIFAAAVIVLLGGGILLTIDILFLNYVVLFFSLLIAGVIFLIRHLAFVRGSDSVIEYLTNGTPLKEPRDIPKLTRFITFASPEEIYETSIEMAGSEWLPIVPMLEESLAKLQESNEEQAA